MRLQKFILDNLERILDEWDRFAKLIPPGRDMSLTALRDHARGILLTIATDIDHAQSAVEQEVKSHGDAPPAQEETEAELHALSRFAEGFDVNQSIAEFRALRASVLRLWAKTMPLPPVAANDMTRFNEAIDQAVAESLRRFTAIKEYRTRLFEALLSGSPDFNYVVETRGALIYANKAFADIFNKTPAELVGSDFLALCSAFTRNIDREMRDAIGSGNTQRGELHVPSNKGPARTYEYLLMPVLNSAGRCEAVAGTARDVTERKEAEARIRRSANHDSLTDLPNRSLFRERLDHELKHSRRTGLPLALLFIDLDGFKKVNDRLGHAAGDQLLQEAAQRIAGCVRDTDTVARLGGDEFTVILTDVTRPDGIVGIADKILGQLRQPFMFDVGEALVSCSIGITIFSADASSREELVRNADAAMYAAKNAGRNQYKFFTPSMRFVASEPAAE